MRNRFICIRYRKEKNFKYHQNHFKKPLPKELLLSHPFYPSLNEKNVGDRRTLRKSQFNVLLPLIIKGTTTFSSILSKS